ncbi:hypothetical protein CTAYLR_010306 [Chrysophaeum taylorii]|uniref:ADP-ribosylation factor-like protein 6 n=1 Tax=Chrysophaeum taylorii TaxID=2483200 RepID=A0AAD7UIE4_9STRA|nr:hypothetical protein CTAYLR_010306 [Chrysophaeum taylorii]
MLRRLSASLSKKPEVHILVVGLDNSGKSSVIAQLKPKKVVAGAKGEAKLETTPTVGFQVEEFQYNNLSLTCFDMSGQSRYRSLWEHYYSGVEAIIFVLDSSDKIRMCVAKNELEELLSHEDVNANPIPIIFFANKMDIKDAMTALECSQLLELDRITNRPWHVTPCNALTGEGITEGVEWLACHVQPASSKCKQQRENHRKM